MPRPGNSKHSTKKRPLTLAPEYADWTLEELENALKPRQYEFARAWIQNGGNSTQAYRDAIWLKRESNQQWAKGKTDTQIANKINGSAGQYLRTNTLVHAYILKSEAKRRAELAERDRFSYEQWLDRMNSLSDGAEREKQYSPAIRAQELIGKAVGHIDANRQDITARMADNELSGKLADILGTTADTLNRALKSGSVVPGEVVDVEPENVSQIEHLENG